MKTFAKLLSELANPDNLPPHEHNQNSFDPIYAAAAAARDAKRAEEIDDKYAEIRDMYKRRVPPPPTQPRPKRNRRNRPN